MHKWVTHNRHYATYATYATYDAFTAEILEFFRKTLPKNWTNLRNTSTDNFRVISTSQYKDLWATVNERMDKLFALIAWANSEDERQAAEQAILQMILTHAKTVVREFTFTFPDYPGFCSWRKIEF